MEDRCIDDVWLAELRINKKMIPATTHQIWVGSLLPDDLSGYRQRMIELNPHCDHRLWDEQGLKAIGFDYYDMANRFPSHAGLSNAARIFVLRKFGGIFFDCDFIPIKPIDSLLHMGDAIAAQQADGRICNAFMGAKSNSPWIKWQAENMHKYEGVGAFWGVDLATESPRDDLTIIPSNLVYPFSWDSPVDERVAHEDTIMMHTWKGSWLP